jgi:carotenoid cleavage dioxygenase-like enzyme
MINQSIKFGARSSHSFFRLKANEQVPKVLAKLVRSRPTYQHSFGLTENWIVFTEFPFAVNPLDIIRTGRPFIENFKYLPEEGTRITLIHRETGEIGGEWQAEPGFCFHHVNAYETNSEVVVDLCRFDDALIVEQLYLEHLRNSEVISMPYMHRYRLVKGASHAIEERLSDEPMELPRINYKAHNQRAYRYAYGTGTTGHGALDKIVRIDTTDGSALGWHESGCGVGEPVFVAAPDATAEDDGVVLTIVLDGDRARSFLLVLDARDLSELGRAEVSHHIPAGFHGSYVH